MYTVVYCIVFTVSVQYLNNKVSWTTHRCNQNQVTDRICTVRLCYRQCQMGPVTGISMYRVRVHYKKWYSVYALCAVDTSDNRTFCDMLIMRYLLLLVTHVSVDFGLQFVRLSWPVVAECCAQGQQGVPVGARERGRRSHVGITCKQTILDVILASKQF